VQQFITKHADKINGTISCFDRVLFKGHLPLRWPAAVEGLLARQGLLRSVSTAMSGSPVSWTVTASVTVKRACPGRS